MRVSRTVCASVRVRIAGSGSLLAKLRAVHRSQYETFPTNEPGTTLECHLQCHPARALGQHSERADPAAPERRSRNARHPERRARRQRIRDVDGLGGARGYREGSVQQGRRHCHGCPDARLNGVQTLHALRALDSHVSVIMMTAYRQADKEHSPAICVICKRPIPPGSGRFRTEEGDVHEECYRERREKSPLRPPAESRRGETTIRWPAGAGAPSPPPSRRSRSIRQ